MLIERTFNLLLRRRAARQTDSTPRHPLSSFAASVSCPSAIVVSNSNLNAALHLSQRDSLEGCRSTTCISDASPRWSTRSHTLLIAPMDTLVEALSHPASKVNLPSNLRVALFPNHQGTATYLNKQRTYRSFEHATVHALAFFAEPHLTQQTAQLLRRAFRLQYQSFESLSIENRANSDRPKLLRRFQLAHSKRIRIVRHEVLITSRLQIGYFRAPHRQHNTKQHDNRRRTHSQSHIPLINGFSADPGKRLWPCGEDGHAPVDGRVDGLKKLKPPTRPPTGA
jgi:hypothetical protein